MDDFCRCCANKSSILTDIYIKDNDQPVNAADKLKIFHKLEVEGQSMLSKKICNDCSLQLGIAFDFFQKLVKAQDVLKNVLIQLQQKKIRLLLPKTDHISYTCVKCSNTYPNKLNFEEHMKQHSVKKRLYQCYFCPESFTTRKLFRDHVSSHSVGDICKFCHTFLADKACLDHHISEEHSTSKYVCLNCSQEYHSRRTLILHMKEKHQGILFYCGECKQGQYQTIDELNKHIIELHPKYKDNLPEEDIFMDEEFLDEFFLNQDDNFNFNEYWDSLSLPFDVDLRDKVNAEKDCCSDSEVRFRCPHCPKGFDKQIALKIHLAHEHNIQALLCTSCDSSFNRLEDLKKHRLLHRKGGLNEESGKNFKCKYCEATFSTSNEYDLHGKAAHTIDKLYCLECNKYFQTVRGLSYHKKTHSGLKKYSCPYCEQKFAIDVGLSAHVRTVHSEIKSNICKLCDRRFATTDHLRKHVTSVHQKERNYLCSICGKGFAQSSHLKQHTQIHTGERPFQCITCGRKFFKRADLVKHSANSKMHQSCLVSASQSSEYHTESGSDAVLKHFGMKECV